MNKEEFIRNVMGSTNGIKPLEPNAFIKTRVFARVHEKQTLLQNKLNPKFAYSVLCGLILLLLINILALNENNFKTKNNSGLNNTEIVNEYFSYTTYNY